MAGVNKGSSKGASYEDWGEFHKLLTASMKSQTSFYPSKYSKVSPCWYDGKMMI